MTVTHSRGRYEVELTDVAGALSAIGPDDCVITDENVREALGLSAEHLALKPGESSKSIAVYGQALDWLSQRAGRGTRVEPSERGSTIRKGGPLQGGPEMRPKASGTRSDREAESTSVRRRPEGRPRKRFYLREASRGDSTPCKIGIIARFDVVLDRYCIPVTIWGRILTPSRPDPLAANRSFPRVRGGHPAAKLKFQVPASQPTGAPAHVL